MPCPCQEDQKRIQQHLEKVQQLRQRPKPPQNDPRSRRLSEKFRQEPLQPQRS